MTTFDQIKPTAGDTLASHEYILDIAKYATTGVVPSSFINVPDFKDFAPAAPPKLANVTTYANKGNTAQRKTGEDWTAQFNVLPIIGDDGSLQPELELLLAAADGIGAENLIWFQYYHARVASLAYQGTAAVEVTRQNTGPEGEIEFYSITLTGQGDRVKVQNPATAPGGDSNEGAIDPDGE
ncbi:hypothetical protein D9V30_10210 [Mycetocola reblochoni]|uniref:Phage major tail protein n=2 Tax=Mycetocola reblochoni TaxID=331618 RepID=A0A1R4JQ99_9MICO|nr:hypothetical protein [Mycetocola reblochoni]RLP68353.1 hypothetical protein D9V30_10210 [Mycetocola reblochoni]SJN34177.1 hypothetical protein FM119_08805 [Mycetocola reblochoni REB411]